MLLDAVEEAPHDPVALGELGEWFWETHGDLGFFAVAGAPASAAVLVHARACARICAAAVLSRAALRVRGITSHT